MLVTTTIARGIQCTLPRRQVRSTLYAPEGIDALGLIRNDDLPELCADEGGWQAYIDEAWCRPANTSSGQSTSY